MIFNNKKFLFTLFLCSLSFSFAQEFGINPGAEVVSRYIWRGTNVNDVFNVQPSLTFSGAGLSGGFWGSYSLSDNPEHHALSQEIDTWISFSHQFENSFSLGIVFTDYYYPLAGIKWGNFNNYNDPNGPGAHTIEAGLIFIGPESLPLTLSGYVNIHNDAGNNTYIQLDYPVNVAETSLNFFVGATGGSTDNPGYYGTESFSVINLGVKASRPVRITEEYSLPVSVAFSINPRTEISYLVFGVTF